MRKLLLSFFLIATFSAAQSQILISLIFGEKLNSPNVEFGLEGGANWASIRGMDASEYHRAFNLGFYFDLRVKNQFFINTGVLVKAKVGTAALSEKDLDFLGTTNYETSGKYDQVIHYFNVPVLAKYKFKNFLYVEAGPQFGLRHKAYVEYNSEHDGVTARIRDDNREMIHRIDAGGIIGFGYHLMQGTGMTLGIKYYHGFVSVYKDKPGTYNSGLYLKVNIPIGRGKKVKKLEE